MADIRVPKELVDRFSASFASKVDKAESDLERRGLTAIRDDPGRAMLALLQPHLKGNILLLSTKYSYGDLEVEDRGDGYYHVDIPDEFISKTLPPEFGQAAHPAPQGSEQGRKKMLDDLITATLLLVTALEDGEGTGGERTRCFMETASETFGKITGSQVTVNEVMTLQAERAKQAVATRLGPDLDEVKNALDRLSDQMENEDKVLLVSSMLRMVGQDPRTKDDFLRGYVGFACLRLGVEWDHASGKIVADPAGSLKRLMFDAEQKKTSTPEATTKPKAPEKKKRWWRRSPS
ncbi:MAG TPA: hypothetical protein VLM38_09215 [Blastocatellia bacterium]|nr:hypothetical protein [Blastocatellia bacterium]